MLLRIVVNLLRADPSTKVGAKAKRLKASADDRRRAHNSLCVWWDVRRNCGGCEHDTRASVDRPRISAPTANSGIAMVATHRIRRQTIDAAAHHGSCTESSLKLDANFADFPTPKAQRVGPLGIEFIESQQTAKATVTDSALCAIAAVRLLIGVGTPL